MMNDKGSQDANAVGMNGGRLTGRVALVTGAARGQGAAQAQLIAREGATAILCDILDEEGEKEAAEIVAAGGQAIYRHMDVSSSDQWTETVAFVNDSFGTIDVLVGNAGILDGASVTETDDESWDRLISINQKGVFLGMRHCIPGMIEAGGGSVINISSVLGQRAVHPDFASYSASKHAIIGMSRSAARSYGKHGVRVNALCPGIVLSAMALEDPEQTAELVKSVPLGRGAEPLEVAQSVVFLASDEAAYITGSVLTVDGGLLA